MKLLLDENLPKRLKQDFKENEIYTAADKGWAGISNGKLLEFLKDNSLDVLLTFDKNLQYQQNFSKYTIAVLVLTIGKVALPVRFYAAMCILYSSYLSSTSLT